MSDLYCPATFIVARHGKAAYSEDWFSDEGGSLTREGRAQAGELADSVEGRRVAAVFSSDISRAVQTAEIVAARLGVSVTACKSLREVSIGSLLGGPFDVSLIDAVTDHWYAGSLDARFEGGESGLEVVERHRAQLEEIADLHRGETVLVVGHQTALGIVVPTLAREVSPTWARDHELTNCASVELDLDADGWELRRWGEQTIS